jgi:hypothetical protein
MIVELILVVILIVIYYTMVVKQEHFVSDNLLGASCPQNNALYCCYNPEIFNDNCNNCSPEEKYDLCVNYGASSNFCNQNM